MANQPLKVKSRIKRWFGYTDKPKVGYPEYDNYDPSDSSTSYGRVRSSKRFDTILVIGVFLLTAAAIFLFMLARYYDTHPDQHDLTFMDWVIEHVLKVFRSFFLGSIQTTNMRM